MITNNSCTVRFGLEFGSYMVGGKIWGWSVRGRQQTIAVGRGRGEYFSDGGGCIAFFCRIVCMYVCIVFICTLYIIMMSALYQLYKSYMT